MTGTIMRRIQISVKRIIKAFHKAKTHVRQACREAHAMRVWQ